MTAKKEAQAGWRSEAQKPESGGTTGAGDFQTSQDESSVLPRPLFVFNVKLFDDRLLPPVLSPQHQWPHRYVVVIRHPDGTVQGECPEFESGSRRRSTPSSPRARSTSPHRGRPG